MLMLMLMLFSTRGEAVGCICVSVRKAKDVDPGFDAHLEFFRSYLDEFH